MTHFTRLVGTIVLTLSPLFAIAPGWAADAASDYPSRAVHLIVTYPPGGSTDIVGRIIADGLSEQLGQPVVVENRGGANGILGMENAARSRADGYTIVLTTVGTWAVNPSLYKTSYDVVKDFEPVIMVTTSPGVLAVNPSLPVQSVKDLIALAKSEPGKLNYGSAGIGGFGHISGAMFALMSGIQITHVPYKGAGQANLAAASGEIQMVFSDAIPAMSFIHSGRLRPLAVTSLKHAPILPNLPTISESGVKDFDNSSWMAMGVPEGTPPAIVDKLNKAINVVLKKPKIAERLATTGAVVVGGTAEQFATFLKSEIAKFAKVVKDANITTN